MLSKIFFLLHICLSIDCLSTDHPFVRSFASTEHPAMQKLILASSTDHPDHQNLVQDPTITDVEGFGPPGPPGPPEYLASAPGQPLEVHISFHQYPGYGGKVPLYPGTYGYGYQYPSYYEGMYAKYVKDSTEQQMIARLDTLRKNRIIFPFHFFLAPKVLE